MGIAEHGYAFNNDAPRSERFPPAGFSAEASVASLALGAEHPLEQQPRPGLGERFVEVAALRRLHAGGAAGGAGALGDQAVGVAAELLEALEGGARDADPAGVAVVDEDRRAAGLGVEVGGEPADVPAIAHRDQGQHRDLGVLGGVERAEERLERDRVSAAAAALSGAHCRPRRPVDRQLAQPQRGGVELEPERLRGEARGGEVEPDELDRARDRRGAGAGRRARCR